MFFNFFSMMNIKKVMHGSFCRGKWGNLPNFLQEVELLVFNNIQGISTLVCLLLDDNWFLKCNYSIIYNTCLIEALSWKVTFSAIAKLTPRAVSNLQASDFFHCEEEPGTNRDISLHKYTLLSFFFVN